MAVVSPRKLSSSDERIARRFKQLVLEITPVERIVVYGSRARGDATPESDMDIFIETPELDKQLRQRIREVAWEISLEEGLVLSTFIASTKAIQTSPLGGNPILKTIVREGITV